ncbi:uncharacterized protein FOMMEDRAFT_159381 [Fomitiporia mediterranea MF3/22]|uniref:uncharacterized protein n=1 Tax=Fomitiporia mediterranea (strain MF3/22) TaxID=694068 RepID=UPI000440891A|nr:uncharacterized protein FOMMEDRAFT_159381 [Fomitiporia mediterranea MF3/22]EJD00620.1 hypothetical protein FOMMEDRAFT_159381 [Fomitiporia mediterranea MF3/22]
MSNAASDSCSILALSCIEVIAGICFDFASIRRDCTQCTWPYSCRSKCCPCGESQPVGPIHLPDEEPTEQSPIRSEQPKPHPEPNSAIVPVR